jgi:hypothetical protein
VPENLYFGPFRRLKRSLSLIDVPRILLIIILSGVCPVIINFLAISKPLRILSSHFHFFLGLLLETDSLDDVTEGVLREKEELSLEL